DALPGEIKRVSTFGGKAVGDDTLHVTIRDDSATPTAGLTPCPARSSGSRRSAARPWATTRCTSRSVTTAL
ncbi:hypothetical protein C7E25_25050, partial [Stenotrophomonas maltophilia]